MLKFTKQDKRVEDWKHEKSGCETIIYLSGTDFVAYLLEEWYQVKRVMMLAEDREAWLTNAKNWEKENQRLQAIIKEAAYMKKVSE